VPAQVVSAQELDETASPFTTLKPLKVSRVDWRSHGRLKKHRRMVPPMVYALPHLIGTLSLLSLLVGMVDQPRPFGTSSQMRFRCSLLVRQRHLTISR
jgi:hypothetical protein